MKLRLTLLIAFIPLVTMADQWTPEEGKKISVINPGVLSTKSAFISLKDSAFVADTPCTKTNGALLHGSNQSFNEIYSLLLAARVSDKPIRIYYGGCQNNYPIIKQAYILPE